MNALDILLRRDRAQLHRPGPQAAGGEAGACCSPPPQNFRTVALSPWLLIPVLFVVATVMTFMFRGDGLRDAADRYK